MSCEAIHAAMVGFDACEPTLDGARIATHCLYPSFELVRIYVVKDGDTYIVHDGSGAYHAAWAHGREGAIVKAITGEAARYCLAVEGNRLVLHNVAAGWLRPAILAVANASASAANFVMARVKLTQEEMSNLASEQQARQGIARPVPIVSYEPSKAPPCAHIQADYEEYKPETFKGFIVELSEEPGVKYGPFDTEDEAGAFAFSRVEKVYTMSSVDNYKSDLARGSTH